MIIDSCVYHTGNRDSNVLEGSKVEKKKEFLWFTIKANICAVLTNLSVFLGYTYFITAKVYAR
jgi:hypothetical protein